MVRNSTTCPSASWTGYGRAVNVTFLGAGGRRWLCSAPRTSTSSTPPSTRASSRRTPAAAASAARVARCTQASGIDHRDITDLEFTLDEDEQADGLALLCMCHLVGDITLETQSDWGMRVGE